YAPHLDAQALRGIRLGVVRKFAGFSPDVDVLFAENIAALKRAGATIVDPVELPNAGKYGDDESIVLQYELKHDLNAYLGGLPASSNAPHSLAELIQYNERERARELPWFDQDLFEKAQLRGPLTDKAYAKALAKEKSLAGRNGIDAALSKHKLDAL